jgi:hypothetical protein
MNLENITGGVSPIKARQKSRGGGHAGAATRTSGQRGGFAKSTGVRGGGGRNVGGYNVRTRFKFTPRDRDIKGSTPDKKETPSTVPNPVPTPNKPYSIDDKGNIVINNNFNPTINTGDPTATATATATSGGDPKRTGRYIDKYKTVYDTKTTGTSYQQAWDQNLTDLGGGKKKDQWGRTYNNIDEFIKASKEYNERTGHTTMQTSKTARQVWDGQEWVWDDEVKDDKSSSSSASASASAGTNTESDDDDSDAPTKFKWYRSMKKFRK